MDLSIFLGIVGIVVSIGVGFGTFYIADKRAKGNLWQTAKDIILRDLSNSLGDGYVPDASAIKSTIRSVLRSQNVSDLSVVTFEEISDDLLHQITADPFLEPERRKQLQNDVIKLKEEQSALEENISLEEENEELIETKTVTKSALLSIIAGIIASVLASASLTSIKPLVEFAIHANSTGISNYEAMTIAALVTVFISILSIIVSRRNKYNVRNTIIVPAKKESFEKEFLGNNCWYAIRIGKDKINDIRYIAAYQTAPISAVTHYAKVESIEQFGNGNKYKLNFSSSAKSIKPIKFGDNQSPLQSPRYTTYKKLKSAKKGSELFT